MIHKVGTSINTLCIIRTCWFIFQIINSNVHEYYIRISINILIIDNAHQVTLTLFTRPFRLNGNYKTPDT